MRNIHRPARLAFLAIAVIFMAGAALAGFAQAMSTVTSVEGAIAAISGQTATLTLANGATKTVAFQPKTIISRVDKSSLAEIKPGDALGVTSRRESDGSLTALKINIFSPEIYKIVPRREFVMTTGDTMTNAVVKAFAKSVDGQTLTMTLPSGASTIKVAPDVPVFRMVSVKEADLTTGLHVVVRGTQAPDGTLRASSVSFDKPAKG
jgi:cellobiose-specific phosphotransferase system component IIC